MSAPDKWPVKPMGAKRGTGYIYFLLAEENLLRPMMKIGFSLSAPDRRLSGCQTGSPTKLDLVAMILGSMADEKALHRRFSKLSSHGEWFFYEGELQSFIEELDI